MRIKQHKLNRVFRIKCIDTQGKSYWRIASKFPEDSSENEYYSQIAELYSEMRNTRSREESFWDGVGSVVGLKLSKSSD